jgi:hypothetical protein
MASPHLALGLAAASSFGAGFGLLLLPAMMPRGGASRSAPADYVRWSPTWFILALVLGAGFIVLLGPGLEHPS